MRRRAWLVLALLGCARVASAQSNEAAAEALFNEGRALIDGGRVDEGCKKLEASHALDAGTGTLIHLGDCYEKLGRTATAWARFRDAAARAAREKRSDWETVANARARELEPKLGKLRVDAPPGVVVRRDGQEIPAAALGSPLPLDPGDYTFTASQSGKKTWTTRATVAAAAIAVVTVPSLEDERAAPADETNKDSGSTLRILGFTAGGVGIVGLVVGTVTGLRAASLDDRSKQVCPNDGPCADDAARQDNDNARSAATISTIAFVAGGALLATGLTLVLIAPSSTSRPSAGLRASPGAIFLEGTW